MARPISVSRPTTTDGELNPGVITPPDKHSLPLTPPASTERHAPLTGIEGVLEILDDCRIRFCVPKSPIKLRSQAYDQLITVLRDHQVLGRYTQDKLRFDYDPRSELLCIRMPAPVHDALATFVANEIHESVRAIRHLSNSAGDFATHIVNVGSSRIWLREEAAEGDEPRPPRLQRQPDAQFQHRKATYPGVVLEVSYSQDGKDLKKLAWDYIQCSDGDIKVVIGIDINYGSAASTVSLWRPKYIWEEGEELLDVEPEIDSQVCDPGSGLEIKFNICSHFGPRPASL
ncbi:hypothetical protein BX600DRAFT_70857 [Xylariales sp. PMI_506]|nr:hypothetical protein BX600DRAFT_70857 [Xylariales sp. PMI_506]